MKNIKLPIKHIVILVLILFNILLSLLLNNFKQINNSLVINNKTSNQEIHEINDFIYQRMDIELGIDSMFNKNISDVLLKSGSKICCFISHKHCSQCILRILMDLQMLSSKIGKNRIVIVGDFKDKKEFEENVMNVVPDAKKILMQNILSIKEMKYIDPVIFILEPDYKIKLFYCPENLPKIKDLYFSRLKEYFKRDSII